MYSEIFSNDLPIFFGVVLILFSLLYSFFRTRRPLPPGPTGLPFLGYWPFLSHDTGHLQLQELGKKYGDLFSLRSAGRLYLHLGSNKAAKEVHINHSESFAHRIDDFDLVSSYFREGLVSVKGEAWKMLRKFFLQQLRERGMNVIKESLSGPIYDNIRETVEDIKKAKGDQPVDIASIVFSKCNNVMRQTLFGEDGIEEDELRKCCEYYSYELMSMTVPNLLLSGKISKYLILPFCKHFREGAENHALMVDLLSKIVKRRKATFDENNVRDCIDAYFKEKLVRQSKNDPTAKLFTDKALVISLVQIIGDGIFFLSMFVVVFFKALLKYPDEQEKIYNELMDVCGVDRNPCIEDRSKLTYTNAFIAEVMRTSDTVPFFTSLQCTKETIIRGYRIPKGTVTVYNFWMAHMRHEDYEEPEKFNSSRFIAKDGERKPELLPFFGIGKRSCIGEGFAMIQVFLFVTTILKHFRLTTPKGMEESQSLYFNYEPLNVCAQLRSHSL